MKKTTLADIAKALNVSKSLVSFVLNGVGDRHGINKETQQRVLDKAQELNYTPHSIAKGLRVGRTNTIGLIVADIANPFFARMARSIEDDALSKGYELFFSSSDESPEREKKLIELMRNRLVDGMIISSTFQAKHSAVLDELSDIGYPFVLIDRYFPDTSFSYVVSDNHKGAYDLTEHICQTGRKRIALFAITPSHLSSIKDRVEGYRKALIDNGIPVDEALIFHIPFDRIEQGVEEAFSKMNDFTRKIDAILTLNNSIAGPCLRQCQIYKLQIPKDISFATFDDVHWFELSRPSVTGVSQPIVEIGQRAVEILIQKIEGTTPEKSQVLLPVSLAIRDSSSYRANGKSSE